MKRVLALVLAVCMLVVFLPACGSSTPQPAPETPKAQTAEDLGVDLSKEVVGGQKEGAEYNFAIVYGGVHPFFDPWLFGAQQAV